MTAQARWLVAACCLFPATAFGWPPRTDALGDPLPSGAVARLGSPRMRHGHYISCVAFTPDGKHVVSASRLGDVRMWEAVGGREVRSFPGHRLGVHSLALSRDGKLLATGGGEPALRVCEIATGREVASFA